MLTKAYNYGILIINLITFFGAGLISPPTVKVREQANACRFGAIPKPTVKSG